MVDKILHKIDEGIALTEADALELLKIPNMSTEYYQLLEKANRISRRDFGDKGYIFAQIGLNVAPCSGNCSFCSLAQCNSTFADSSELSLEEVLKIVSQIDFQRVTALFLMTTADFDQDRFLEYGRAVKQVIPAEIALVANTGDFDLDYARRLKEAGFTGVYHIVRLREGIDTALQPEMRIRSLDAAAETGLRIYYCLEPIGPEHSYEEMVPEMMRARHYHVDVMAAMRRVSVTRTKYECRDMVDDFEMAKIVAVTRLVVMPKVSMNVHEPIVAAMLGGVNQLYAEIGVNPRDTTTETQNSRGYSVDAAAALLASAGYRACVEK